MSDRPILFSGPMIRALLEGRKTQTRRVIKPQPKLTPHHEPVRVEKRGVRSWVWMVHTDRPAYQFATGDWKAPYAVGDRLWVREAWSGVYAFRDVPPAHRVSVATPDGPILHDEIWYWADGNPDFGDWERPRPSIFMPRWASRLTLIVTDVRVQRLQEISEWDAREEGVHLPEDQTAYREPHKISYSTLWDSLNAKRGYGWDVNPWVVALTFNVIKQNIDQIEKEAA